MVAADRITKKLGIGVNIILLFLSSLLHRLSLKIRSAAMGVTPTLAQPVAAWKSEPLPITSSSRQNLSQYLLIYPQLRILSAGRELFELAQNFGHSSPLVTALLSCFCKDHIRACTALHANFGDPAPLSFPSPRERLQRWLYPTYLISQQNRHNMQSSESRILPSGHFFLARNPQKIAIITMTFKLN